MEKSQQGCYETMQIGFCDSHYNNIMDIQNRLSYLKVLYPAMTVLFSCLMEEYHGVGTGPTYPFRKIKSHFEVVPGYMCHGDYFIEKESFATEMGKDIKETVKKYH